MPVNKQELDRAVMAALNGPEVRDVCFLEYRFNVKPAKITRSGGTIRVVGDEDKSYISRRRSAANDRIYYTFYKTGGIVKLDEIEIKTSRGGVWGGLWRHRVVIWETLKKIWEEWVREQERRTGQTGQAMSLTPDEQERLAAAGYEESKRLLDGSWKGEASFLVTNIALRAR